MQRGRGVRDTRADARAGGCLRRRGHAARSRPDPQGAGRDHRRSPFAPPTRRRRPGLPGDRSRWQARGAAVGRVVSAPVEYSSVVPGLPPRVPRAGQDRESGGVSGRHVVPHRDSRRAASVQFLAKQIKAANRRTAGREREGGGPAGAGRTPRVPGEPRQTRLLTSSASTAGLDKSRRCYNLLSPARWIKRSSATSPSSPTSTTASPRWRTASSR